MKTLESVMKNLIIPENFGIESESESTIYFDDVLVDLYHVDADWFNGCTKLVVTKDDLDVVFKLPFNGMNYDKYDEEEECYNFDFFEHFEGAWAKDHPEVAIDDYCDAEATIYEDAKEAGVEEFFAETIFYDYTANHYPIYIQEKVKEYYSKANHAASEESTTTASKRLNEEWNWGVSNLHWVAEAIDWYGEDKVTKLMKFIKDNYIDDLHNGNIGYRMNGAPVILDYSNFNS